jgi:hypothetical protein
VPPTITIFWTCDIVYVVIIIGMSCRKGRRVIDIFGRRTRIVVLRFSEKRVRKTVILETCVLYTRRREGGGLLRPRIAFSDYNLGQDHRG